MKKKQENKILSLKKETIASLGKEDLVKIRGGAENSPSASCFHPNLCAITGSVSCGAFPY